MLVIIAVFLFTTVALGQDANLTDGIRVTTEQGTVVGFKATDGDYLAFYSIRYAGDVSGANRFRAAPPPPKIEAEFIAYDRNIVCAQPSPQGVVGVEDCLTLNIFTRNVTGTRPVYVWVNGEEYSKTNDTPHYSYKYFVEADLIFVALNYRLSIFGFLCLGVEEAPGNAGLKDVIQALQWIKANIAAFGGDPDNVILMGHGSGAAMVDLISLSPQSENLVHKVVAISGSGIAPWAVAFEPLGYAKAFAAKVNYTDDTNQKLARNLVATNIDLLVNAVNDFEFTNNSVLFAPCVENVELKGSLLKDAPINIIRSAENPQIPYLAMIVGEEGTMRAAEAFDRQWLEKMNENFLDFLPVDLKFSNETTKKIIGQKIREHYFRHRVVNKDSIRGYLDYQADTLITIPVIRGLQERAAAVKQVTNGREGPIYLIELDISETPDTDWLYPGIPQNGTRHGDILKYIFNVTLPNYILSGPQKPLLNRFIAFAKSGIPIAPYPEDGAVDIRPMDVNRVKSLNITGQNRPKGVSDYSEWPSNDLHEQDLKFWKEQVSQYYAAPERVHVNSGHSPSNKAITMCVGLITGQFFLKNLLRF